MRDRGEGRAVEVGHAPQRVFGPLALTVAAAMVLVGSFLPWLRSGQRDRTSYEMYGVLRRLDLVDGALASGTVRAWPLVPVVVALVAITGWAGRATLAAALAVPVAAYVGAVCVVAWRSPLPAEGGVAVTFIGATTLLGAGLGPVWRRARRTGS